MGASIVTPRQFVKVIDTLEEKGVTGEMVQNDLLGAGRLADLAEAMVLGVIPNRESFRNLLGLTNLVYRLIVDYTMNFTTLLSDGQYTWADPCYSEINFPKTGEGVVSINAELLQFGQGASSKSITTKMGMMGYRPATMWELLAFGAQNPSVQQKFSIVALGSFYMWNGYRYVGVLTGNDLNRNAYFQHWGSVWGQHERFLAVRIK